MGFLEEVRLRWKGSRAKDHHQNLLSLHTACLLRSLEAPSPSLATGLDRLTSDINQYFLASLLNLKLREALRPLLLQVR